MKIIIDTREKADAIKGIIRYFDQHDVAYERAALKTGDYMLEGHPEKIIDRKRTLNELAHNLLSRDRERFLREVRRAREAGIKLVVLCEEGPSIRTIEDVRKWRNEYGHISGKALSDAIFRLELSYGIPTFFCSKKSTPQRIIELLTEDTHA